jgi:cyclopropane-fatty-acyl-phospholipid synthase
MLFGVLLRQVVKRGSLTLYDAGGKRHEFGDGTGANIIIRLHDRVLHRSLAINPYLKLGEAYMDGGLTVDAPHRIYDLLDLILGNLGTSYASPLFKAYAALRRAKRRIDQHNPVGRAQENVAHHYDLDGGIYDLFLDADKQYSCAYFTYPGMQVLDIGCGWGGLALSLAEEAGASVVGVTLSREQHKIATARVAARGLSDQISILLQDYRTLTEKFDRIVSVGMFEHVGVGHFGEYFTGVRDMLNENGVALIHTIGRLDPPGATNPWIAKYIFPGGYIPALSEMSAAVEKTGLLITDVEILRLHYAETLREWRHRFMAHWDEAARIYDDRFCRMWEFYLAGSELSFRHEGMVNFQMQLTRRIDVLPLTRDYMVEREGKFGAQTSPRPQLKASD